MQTADWRKGGGNQSLPILVLLPPRMEFCTRVLQGGEELGEAAVVQLSGSKWVASLWTLTPLS